MGKRKFAMVCSSNQNRSMEAHGLLKSNGLLVESFGVGQRVKLPGTSAHEPNVYEFGTPYVVMYKDLEQKAEEHYKRKGLLPMLERNSKIKEAPERWQNSSQEFDVAFTFEERIMDQLLEDMNTRRGQGVKPLLVVNMDVTDSHEEAASAAPLVLKFCKMLDDTEDALDAVDSILKRFEQETGRQLLHQLCYY